MYQDIVNAANMFRRSINIRLNGYQKFKGDDISICNQMVEKSWNGNYFQVSNGNYPHFWIRDFGMCIDSFMKSKFAPKAKKSLEYLMPIFAKSGLATTVIGNKIYNFSGYSPDSLVFLLRSLRIAGLSSHVKKYENFFVNEIKKFQRIIEPETGLIRFDKKYSGMRDYAIRKSSCYNNTMIASLQNEIRMSKYLPNNLMEFNHTKLLLDNFWNDSYFRDSINNNIISGDANTLPFFLEVIKNKNMLKKSIDSVRNEGLDKPFPLKYVSHKANEKMIWQEIFVPGWERNSVWSQLGFMYINNVSKVNKDLSRNYLSKYQDIIQKYKNFFEVYDNKGKPYKSPFFCSDDAMMWAVMYLGAK